MCYLTILLAAVSNFILGGLWYSKVLFGNIWMKEEGITPEQMKGHGARPFVMSFIYAVIAAIGFCYLVQDSLSLMYNLKIGLLIGVVFVGTSFGVNYEFCKRGTKLILIDAGYHIVQFILYALIFWYVK